MLSSAPVAFYFPFYNHLYNIKSSYHTSPTANMQYSSVILLATFAITNVFAHGVITEVQGANGVNMPGLSGTLS